MKFNFGTMGHYVVNKATGLDTALTAFLAEKDPDGMSQAEIDAKLSQLEQVSAKVSKAHTADDEAKAAFEAAAAQNAIRLKTAENAQKKIETETDPQKKASMQAELNDYLDSLQEDQTNLDNLKAIAESAHAFYENAQRLYDERVKRLKKMKSDLTVAANTMKTAQTRRDMSAEQAKEAKELVGGSKGPDKFEIAMNAFKTNATKASQEAEANERIVKSLGTKSAPNDSFMGQLEAEAAGTANPPQSSADRIAALRAKAA